MRRVRKWLKVGVENLSVRFDFFNVVKFCVNVFLNIEITMMIMMMMTMMTMMMIFIIIIIIVITMKTMSSADYTCKTACSNLVLKQLSVPARIA